MPEGLSFFNRSVSPDRSKERTTLCSLCLCGEKANHPELLASLRIAHNRAMNEELKKESDTMSKVENLKKISLKLEAGTSAQNMDLSLDKTDFEFIFGIGPSGITAFEYELVDKTEGQEVIMELKKENLAVFFEHLRPPIIHLEDNVNTLFLKIKIQTITDAEQREVVKALADVTAHGHGCDCGCGC